MLESDYLIFVNYLNENFKCLTEFNLILQDIRKLMNRFEEARLEYVYRLDNGAAYQLTRYVREVKDIVI